MGRLISEFKGHGVVIGCSHYHNFCCTKDWHNNKDEFYTIDVDHMQTPDFVFNICSQMPETFKLRFELTFLENIDFTAYNDFPLRRQDQGIQGFQNVWDMTADNGFIVIKGCPRKQEFRKQILTRNLHYIELDANENCILIPKNQNLSPNEVMEQIELLHPALQKIIKECQTADGSEKNSNVSFCDLSLEELPSLYPSKQKNSYKEPPQITAFRRIYFALYQGQSYCFKQKNPLLSHPALSIEEIEAYVEQHPRSRSAKAWSLTHEHLLNVKSSNKALFKEIHQYSYERSSNFYGLFRCSVNFSNDNYDNFAEQIEKADANSRTGKISAELNSANSALK